MIEPMTHEEQMNHMVSGLIGAKHLKLFHMDAVFHEQVYRLARLLPLWVDAIAAEAQTGVDVREEAIRQLRG